MTSRLLKNSTCRCRRKKCEGEGRVSPNYVISASASTVTRRTTNQHQSCPTSQLKNSEQKTTSWTSSGGVLSNEAPPTGVGFDMGLEEQKEEREVLDSIFPDEITGAHTHECRRAPDSHQRQTHQIMPIGSRSSSTSLPKTPMGLRKPP